MYTPEEHFVMNLADIYSLLFGYIGDGLIRAFSMQGEASVREAARRFGKDRRRTLREKHLSIGAKINMKNLFSLYPDLPSDPRFRRELQSLAPQERISHTLFCPMAEIWESHGLKELGRIYCEEFHPACYGEYAYGLTSVNLARTQTQENDAYCSFRVILRPADLPAKLRATCFADFDPDYHEPPYDPQLCLSGKDGFEMLSIKLYYYLLATAMEQIGEECIPVIGSALKKLSDETALLLEAAAGECHRSIDDAFIYENVPISRCYESRARFWRGYDGYDAQALWEKNFYTPLVSRLAACALVSSSPSR